MIIHYIPQGTPELLLIETTSNKTRDGHIIGKYKCSCGRIVMKSISRVNWRNIRYCGSNCPNRSPVNIKHGMKYTREYSIWRGIKSRCLNSKDKDYNKYSKLGISEKIANDFIAFLSEVGVAPTKEHQIDRINNTVGYFEGNMRWATRSEQERNTSTSYRIYIDDNKFNSLKEASDFYKVSIMTIVRWCDGYVDKRRSHQNNGGLAKPRKGCRRELYY